MELTREAYMVIVQHLDDTADLCNTARISRAFKTAAQLVLYRNITIHNDEAVVLLSQSLADHPHLAVFVESLTVSVGPDVDDTLWTNFSQAFNRTTHLNTLNLHIEGGDDAKAWTLRNSIFQLHTFHSDLRWDTDLYQFLTKQSNLRDLYLADCYNFTGRRSLTEGAQSPTFDSQCLRTLAILECPFADAVCDLIPGRPIVCVKTCFSCEDIDDKTKELNRLGAALKQSRKSLRSLDLADSSYTEDFTFVILEKLYRRLPELRYLGTLVLPIGREVTFKVYQCGNITEYDQFAFIKRLEFFGMLRRFRYLSTIELEVSDWEPAPTTQGLRALANELRLYCTSVKRVIFVQDYERTVVRAQGGYFVVDLEVNTSNLWRDV